MTNKQRVEDRLLKTIAFYIGSLEKGGAERVFVNLAEYFNNLGYRIVMVTQYKKENEYTLPHGVKRVISDITADETTNSRIKNFFRRFFKLRNIWKIEDVDAVLTCTAKSNFMTIVSCMLLKTHPVVSVVGEAKLEYPGKLMKGLANLLFPLSSGIILQTKRSREFFSKAVNKKAVILPNSLNPSFIKPRYDGLRDKQIVAIGRMDENKNHAMMIRAFSQIANKYPDYELVIYGDGELRPALKELIDELKMSERIKLPGVVTDIADRIYKAYAFIITSDSEGVSNALIEAMASGLAVISTDVPSGGAVELIEDGVNGILIPVRDEAALVNKLDLLLSDHDYADRLGVEATKLKERLSPDNVNEMWKNYFEGILK